MLQRCISSMDEELCIKSEPNPESRSLFLEEEEPVSEPSTPGFTINTPDPSEGESITTWLPNNSILQHAKGQGPAVKPAGRVTEP